MERLPVVIDLPAAEKSWISLLQLKEIEESGSRLAKDGREAFLGIVGTSLFLLFFYGVDQLGGPLSLLSWLTASILRPIAIAIALVCTFWLYKKIGKYDLHDEYRYKAYEEAQDRLEDCCVKAMRKWKNRFIDCSVDEKGVIRFTVWRPSQGEQEITLSPLNPGSNFYCISDYCTGGDPPDLIEVLTVSGSKTEINFPQPSWKSSEEVADEAVIEWGVKAYLTVPRQQTIQPEEVGVLSQH